MFDLIKEDLRAKARICCGGDGSRQILRVLVWDGTFCMMIYRASQFCYRNHLGIFGAIFNQLNPILTHAVIGRRAAFGPGFVVLHSIGLVINSSVKGGSNIVIESGITIGADKDRAPILGHNIYIGSGARIIGGITVGNNVRIGANAVVVHDVPDNVSVGGVPARILSQENKS